MASTIRDVAVRAGVSIKTVSNVINDRPYITPETKQKVLDAIRELRYRPNRSAQALRNRRTQALAAIIPDIQNPFFTSVVRGIEDYAIDAGYVFLLCDSEDNIERETRYVQVLGAGSAAGVVLCTADERVLEHQIATLSHANISVVAIDRATDDTSVDTILAENCQGSYDGIAHLISKGHRRIGIIAGPEYYAPGRERLQGCLDALQSYAIEIDESLIERTDFKKASAQKAARELLNLPDPPSALFISNGESAFGALEVIREMKLRIPDDIALIVFDDPEWVRIIEVPLTVIVQPGYEMGRMAAKILIERIDRPELPLQKVRLPTRFEHRGSCCREP